MDIRFWGVRGSIPCGAAPYSRYGGDTSCVSVSIDDLFLVFDAGSGLRACGQFAQRQGIRKTHLFLSHMHMDHILGLPFYLPLWDKQAQIEIHGVALEAYGGVRPLLKQAFLAPVFPVPLEGFLAQVTYLDHGVGQVIPLTSTVSVTTTALDHPNGSVAYRLSDGKRAVCYVTDTGHLTGALREGALALMAGADLVIYDASFTPEERVGKEHWGHSTWVEGIALCQGAGAKALCLFHHDPDHEDDQMDRIAAQAKGAWDQVIVAKQGMVLSYD